MILTIDEVLTADELLQITTALNQADFVDGHTTAGWHTRQVKHNLQLGHNATESAELKAMVHSALSRNVLFQMVVHPKNVHSLMFSRYEVGMSYGTHIDNALMGSQSLMRSDVSFTLFLSQPSTYEGGELIIERLEGESAFKLSAGSMLVYPSVFLHRVEAVTQGVRMVAVGWVQSLVRDVDKREILFDLDTVRRSIFQKNGKTVEFDLLSKTHANLLRQWAEP